MRRAVAAALALALAGCAAPRTECEAARRDAEWQAWALVGVLGAAVASETHPCPTDGVANGQ